VIDLGEEDIVNGLKIGDESCFVEFVNTYKKKVISLCYSYTKDFQEAEDLSQEVFISLFRSINNFRGDCSFSTYVYKVTVSRCLDFKRKRSIKDFLTGLAFKQSYPEEDIDDKNFIKDCIKALKEELRLPIILHYYIGLNYKEIGEILNTSSKAIEGRIYRAKQKLKVEFEKGGYEEWSRKGII
jgi:RNA polymerase sigma factor (sigma-70 family)